ncbi:MAG: hypothetical protein ACPGSG_08315 [Prolixibacteraceae bacterium]
MNKNYVAGRNFEYRIIRWLTGKGYYVVRSYASKGIFDLVAVPPKSSKLSRALLIQAKYSRKGKAYIVVEEKTRLASASRRYKAHCCIVSNTPRSKRLKWQLVNPYYYNDRTTKR